MSDAVLENLIERLQTDGEFLRRFIDQPVKELFASRITVEAYRCLCARRPADLLALGLDKAIPVAAHSGFDYDDELIPQLQALQEKNVDFFSFPQDFARYPLKVVRSRSENSTRPEMTWAYPVYGSRLALPEEGMRLYISATILNAAAIFNLVIPFLFERKIAFQVAANATHLEKLNNNFFGYLQANKFIKIYPENEPQAWELAEKLHERLSCFESTPIACCHRFKENAIVYYQYGRITGKGRSVDKNVHPTGWDQAYLQANKAERRRYKYHGSKRALDGFSLLAGKYLIWETIRQRAKGGVYKALEISSQDQSVRKVLLKEGRRGGEVERSGVDAIRRREWEFQVLAQIRDLEISPRPYEIIRLENVVILSAELMNAISLRELILDGTAMRPQQMYNLIFAIAKSLRLLQERAIYFFDLCPDNIMVLPDSTPKLIDYEFCLGNDAPPFIGWEVGTPGFFPEVGKLQATGTHENCWFVLRDIYALGRIIVAMVDPQWYRKLFSCVPSSLNAQIQEPELASLPKKLRQIMSRALLDEMPYESITQFIEDFSTIEIC